MTTPRARTRSLDGARHYDIFVDGMTYHVPSASTIAGQLDKPAIRNWLINKHLDCAIEQQDSLGAFRRNLAGGRKYIRSIVSTDTAAIDFGNLTHEAAEAVLTDNLADIPEGFEWVAKHIEEFMTEFEGEVVQLPDGPATERTCFRTDPEGVPLWAGTFDAMIEITAFGGRKRLIVDHKSGASGVWSDAAITTGAYYHSNKLLGVDDTTHYDMPALDGAVVLWLRPEGWSLIPLGVKEVEGVLWGLMQIYQWKDGDERRAVRSPLNKNPLKK